ncbi:hypothetical protein [Niallia sp. NCCP-28]|uniref:hypothetical protein n=1 Tax=Niallia sp. NCCP-28 TaxID=2934712 RepID=UPI00207EA4F8|nr:hypothetical protein [Niallia sp. NCCP-28]GKU82723.1 hypothetical protein NCCP28_21190 [Niallia sp. NCCP-28]
MKITKKHLLLMLVLPYVFLPFIGLKSIKRFLPGALFMCLYVTFEGCIAEKRKWWWFPFTIKPNVIGELPLIFGAFFVGSLWILKYTFGKFSLYLIVNIIIDTIFTYLMIDWFKKIGYVNLVRLSKVRLSFLFMVKSILMYGFQYIYEKRGNHSKMLLK